MHTKALKTISTNGNPVESTLEKKAKNVKTPKEYTIRLLNRSDVKEFIEKWHYSKSINGLRISHCFGLFYETDGVETMIGAMVYGKFAMSGVWKKYGETEDDSLELRRLAMIDSTCRNAESYFISQTLKWIKNNTNVKVIISYADAFHGHEGIIYKASNFTNIGMTSKSRMIEYQGKLYHDKTIRSKHKGVLKPYAQRIVDALKKGDAKYIETPPKTIYEYKIRG